MKDIKEVRTDNSSVIREIELEENVIRIYFKGNPNTTKGPSVYDYEFSSNEIAKEIFDEAVHTINEKQSLGQYFNFGIVNHKDLLNVTKVVEL